jgi:enoyl-CoA hydratase
MGHEISLEVSDGIAAIALNAPERRNALTLDMARDLVSALDIVDGDESVGALVIRGAGKGFCAGATRSVLEAAGDDPASDSAMRTFDAFYSVFVRTRQVKVPTIAAVRGAAVGAGLNLALSTDVRVVATDARLISGFAKIGIHPGGGQASLIAGVAGREAAAAMILFNQEMSGARAAELGLAWIATEDGNVDQVAFDLAANSAHDPALARRMVSSLRHQLGPPAVPLELAVDVDRAHQIWSYRRAKR